MPKDLAPTLGWTYTRSALSWHPWRASPVAARVVRDIPNDAKVVRRAFRRLAQEAYRVEVLPRGWPVRTSSCAGKLTAMSIACEVIAPGLIPVRAGDRVKTIGATRPSWHDCSGRANWRASPYRAPTRRPFATSYACAKASAGT